MRHPGLEQDPRPDRAVEAFEERVLPGLEHWSPAIPGVVEADGDAAPVQSADEAAQLAIVSVGTAKGALGVHGTDHGVTVAVVAGCR